VAHRALLDALDGADAEGRLDVGAVWAALEKIAPRTQLAAAAAQVEEPETNERANIVEVAQARPIIEVAVSPSITSRTNASNASSCGHWVTLPDATRRRMCGPGSSPTRVPGRSDPLTGDTQDHR
jgi:hypothetical protein